MIDLNSSLNLNALNLKPSKVNKFEAVKNTEENPRYEFIDRFKNKDLENDAVEKANNSNISSADNDKYFAPDKSESTRLSFSDEDISKTKSATPKAAMSVFLIKMQNELGISSDEIMKAFSELSPEELLGSPEQSAEAFIAKLNLDPAQSDKAFDMYNEMLAMTAAAGLSQQLMKNNQTAEFNVLSKKDIQLRELRSSINEMSDRFFVTGTNAPTKSTLQQQQKIINAYTQLSGQKDGNEATSDESITTGAVLSGDKLMSNSEATAALGFPESQTRDIILPSEFASMNLAEVNTDSELPEVIENAATKNAVAEPMANEFGIKNAAPLVTDSASFDATSTTLTSVPGLNLEANASTEENFFAEDQSSSESNNDKLQSEDLIIPREGQAVGQKGKTEQTFTLQTAKATPADMQNNVKEIISQARFLADKGGGEMKVSLNPEGLGELNLKVKMIDGKVNVEMITASNDAKKVLEKGLNELKENLAIHKLHLDSVKIENKDISQHLDQQHKDFEQGFQQKFLNDFKDRNQSWRQGMYDVGSASQPGSQTRDKAANDNYDPAAKTKRSRPERRLDLVA